MHGVPGRQSSSAGHFSERCAHEALLLFVRARGGLTADRTHSVGQKLSYAKGYGVWKLAGVAAQCGAGRCHQQSPLSRCYI